MAEVGMKRYLDIGSVVVAAVTLALFVAALFVKGLTKDLFLEVGVLLISIKIIMMSYKSATATERLERKIDAITATLAVRDNAQGNTSN
jgi:hypothetical protein